MWFQTMDFSTNQDIGQKTISNLKMRRLADKTFFPQPTSRGYLADKEIRKVKATCALNSQESQPTYSKSMETWLHGCIWNWGTPIESSGILWHPIAFLGFQTNQFPGEPAGAGFVGWLWRYGLCPFSCPPFNDNEAPSLSSMGNSKLFSYLVKPVSGL